MRKISEKSKVVRSTIEDIPNEVLSEIFARVAASSFTDIFNAKLSCKLFEKIAEDTHVCRHVSLDKFPLVPWKPPNEKQQSFLTKCRKSGNPELIYRQAVKKFFIDKEIESAYKCLQRAVILGHLDAMYVACIVLLLSGDDESIKVGIKVLSRMKKSSYLRSKMRFCREKLIKNLSSVWVENQDLRLPVCCTVQNNHKKRNGWSDIDEEESIQCEACNADNEIKKISDYIHIQ